MICGIDTGLSKDYISKFDTEETKTVWKLGVLSAYAFAYVGSKISDPTKSIEGMIEVVRFGLLGFDNFKDNKGNMVPFATQIKSIGQRNFNIVKDDIINIMPIDLIIELGGKILEQTKLSEQEIKN
jgi:hypothetical protein